MDGVDCDTVTDCKLERCARGMVRVGVAVRAVLPAERASSWCSDIVVWAFEVDTGRFLLL